MFLTVLFVQAQHFLRRRFLRDNLESFISLGLKAEIAIDSRNSICRTHFGQKISQQNTDKIKATKLILFSPKIRNKQFFPFILLSLQVSSLRLDQITRSLFLR